MSKTVPQQEAAGVAGFHAPIAVRAIDAGRAEQPALELGLAADGSAYRGVYLIATVEGAPVTAFKLAAGPEGVIAGAEIDTALAERADEIAIARGAKQTATNGWQPLVSIVVAVIDGGKEVVRCIDAIRAGSYENVELIVVNNRPEAGPLDYGAADAPQGVVVVDQPIAGLSHARNAGLALAQGEIVVFTDDDVVPDERWIERVVSAFQSEPKATCVTGLILPLALETETQLLIERYAGFSKGFERRVFSLDQSRDDRLFPYAAGTFGSGANVAMRTDRLRALGGFDPALGTGTPAKGGEDIDLFIRVLLAGDKLLYEPAAFVWHEHPSGNDVMQGQVFNYGAGLIAAIAKQGFTRGQRWRLVRAIPHGIRFALDSQSPKNVRKGDDFPRSYSRRELLGMAYGPIAYLKSRRRERALLKSGATTDVAPPREAYVFKPTYVQQVDISAPIEDFQAPLRKDGAPYERARLLAQLHGVTLGIVQLELNQGGAGSAQVVEAVNAALGARISEHLAEDGIEGQPLTAAGLPTLEDPPCLAPGQYGDREPFVSVVLCTRDRAESLARAVRSILTADYAKLELVIVDNAPQTDATESVVKAIADDRVRYVLEPVPGLSRARNRGLAEARGDLIAFVDDDIEADEHWLRGLINGFTRGPKVGGVTGLVPTIELDNESQQFFDDFVTWSKRFDRRLFDLKENRDPRVLYPYSAGHFGTGANFAVSADAVRDIGLFDEALGAGAPSRGGEDLDYFLRLILAGWQLAYEPQSVVWHHHRADPESLHQQMWGYGTGATAYGIKAAASIKHGPIIAKEMLRYGVQSARNEVSPDVRGLELRSMHNAQRRGLLAGPYLYLKGRRMSRKHPKIVLPPRG